MIGMGFVKTWNQMAALRGLLGILEVTKSLRSLTAFYQSFMVLLVNRQASSPLAYGLFLAGIRGLKCRPV